MLNPDLLTAPADVLLLPMTDDFTAAVELATRFPQCGPAHTDLLRAEEVQGENDVCRQAGHPYVAFLGEDEIAPGAPAPVKDLRTGQQVSLSPDEAVELIRKGISELNKGSVILEK